MRFIGEKVRPVETRRISPPARDRKVADPLYASGAWKRFRAAVLAERGKRCQDPDCTRPDGPWSQIYLDHVVEISDGGASFDRANILLRCPTCHTRKTARERHKRGGWAPSPEGRG